MRPIIIACLLTCFINFNAIAQNAGDQLFTTDQMHTIDIQFEEDDFWAILTDNFADTGLGGTGVEYLMATSITIDGVVTDSVGIRQKGFSSHFSAPELRKSLKIDCNEFVSGKKVDGLKKFNLHNGVGDPSLQRDFIAYDLMRKAGLAVPRVAYCRLFLNDTYWGIYTIVEQIDKSFVTRNFNDDNGDLFKNTSNSELTYFSTDPSPYKEIFALKTNKAADNWSDFIELMDVINNTSDAEFEERIDQVFNVDQYLRVLGVDIITDNWDSYIAHGRNFYLYHEPVSDQFHWLPWDYNLSFGGRFFSTGEPPVEIDPACDFNALFLLQKDEGTVNFFPPAGLPAGTTISWDFGDGNTSTDLQPTHIYDLNFFQVRACMEITTEIGGVNCDRESCIIINLLNNPTTCPAVINGSSPYPATDSIFQRVIMNNNSNCCSSWSGNCQELYDNIVNGVVSETPISLENDFPAFPDFDGKVLINRLLNVEKYRTRYLDYMCDLKENNYFLSDNLQNLRKWPLPADTEIAANGYLIVWADQQLSQTGLHSNFKLARSGESIYLSHLDGTIIDSVVYEEQMTNLPMARIPNGTGDFIAQASTFNGNNEETTSITQLGPSTFSVYPNPVEEKLTIEPSIETIGQSVHLQIFNSMGQQVQGQQFQIAGPIEVDTKKLVAGIYFVSWQTKAGMVTKKITKTGL